MHSSRIVFLVLALLLIGRNVYANNPTEWPYGGKPDSSRKEILGNKNPLNFERDADFWYSQFSGYVDFHKSNFSKNANFMGSQFSENTTFTGSKFLGNADFMGSKFLGNNDFSDSKFSGNAVFSSTCFGVVDFENTVFSKMLIISNAQFTKGADLRRTDLSKAKIFFDHHTFFPSGTLQVYWSQLKDRLAISDESCSGYLEWNELNYKVKQLDSFQHHLPTSLTAKRDSLNAALIKTRYQLDSLSTKLNRERYALTAIFYNRLRDNYLAQNDKGSADEVMYELASKRLVYLDEFWWRLYGWLFGWGYKPMRFVLTVFLGPVLLFALLWYRKYYHRVVLLVDHTLTEEQKSTLQDPSEREAAFKDTILFARWLHVLYFSTFVLLSIRFKKEWIEKNDRAFLYWVAAEWMVGLLLYVLFFTLVKSHEFGYVKGLLGF